MERHKWKTKYKANSGYSKAGQLKRKITLDAKELEGVYFKRSYGTSAWIELYRLSGFSFLLFLYLFSLSSCPQY